MSPRFISPAAMERIAGELRERANLREFEEGYLVDIESMAKTFGCDVQYVQFTPSNDSARVRVHPDQDSPFDYLIEVNANDSEARRRYSIAHEIAHVILHSEDGEVDFTEYRQPLGSYAEPNEMYKEVQANMLASALLMPEANVNQCWRRVNDIDDLAHAFNVSRDSAYWRVNNLGLLAND